MSYGLNAQLFQSRPNLNRSFADGLSNTILLGEHYGQCSTKIFNYISQDVSWATGEARRPSFADGGALFQGKNEGDVYPITTGSPPSTLPSRSGATFQIQPAVWVPVTVVRREKGVELIHNPMPVNPCDPSLPQTPHRGGMCVALADGSVRTIRGSVSPATFWAMVTPAGGEVLGNDW
jgi:Protein of unknown function (DUF1559)